MHPEFDESWYLAQPGQFEPFRVEGDGELLSALRLPASQELLVFEVNGVKRAVRTFDMVYHHVAQGTVGEEPFLVSFCGACHSGALMDPRVNGAVHQFVCAGMYRGTSIISDEETGTLWDHITGTALHGDLAGTQLKVSPLQVTEVATALKKHPGVRVHMPRQKNVMKRMMTMFIGAMHRFGFVPGFMAKTLPKESDDRLPRYTVGLGVVVGDEAEFFTMAALKKGPAKVTLGGKEVTVAISDADSVPGATCSGGEKPLQYFLRWYGFALTFPGCQIYEHAQ